MSLFTNKLYFNSVQYLEKINGHGEEFSGPEYYPRHYYHVPNFALVIVLFVMIAVYIYASTCIMMIAKKTGTKNSWMAFVPILNLYLIVKIADKPGWWVLLFFLPLANIVVMIITMAEICKRMGFSQIAVLWFFVPIANLIFLGVLATRKPVY